MRKHIFLLSAAVMATTIVCARDIDGRVNDSATGEPLVGSVVRVKELANIHATTGLDGSFSLRGLPEHGQFTLVISYLAYSTVEHRVDLSNTEGRINIALHEASRQLNEVQVMGFREKRTDRSAMALEKNAGTVLNVTSAQSIQLSPDINVANVLQRVSGVTMEKDATGEASYAILRGMDKRYNYTLINGVKIPSPDDKNRYIPLNLFPSDLMDRLVVSKTLTADMEGDAAGGVVDMVMKDAPARFSLQANAAIGTTDYYMHSNRSYLSADRSDITRRAPYETMGADYKATTADFKTGGTRISSHDMPAPNVVAGLSVGHRFWDNRVGVTLAGSLQNLYRGTERTYNGVKMATGQATMYVHSLQHRYYSIHDLTGGLHAKIDFAPVRGHKIEWYNMLVGTSSESVRYTNTIKTEYIDKTSYSQDDETRSMQLSQRILATHLKGTHHFGDDLTVDWAGIFSEARAKDPDRVYQSLTNYVTTDDTSIGGYWTGNHTIAKTQPRDMTRRFQHNTDRDWAGYANIAYDQHLTAFDVLWKAGAQYRRKERKNRFYSYDFNPSDITQTLQGNGFDQYKNIGWTCTTPYSQASQLNYDSKEHIGGTYGMLTLKTSWAELYAGCRVEHTNQIYTMLQKFKNMGQVGEQSYWDVLPSASLKWKPTDNMNIRLSYYRSINRPGFYEIVPYQLMGEEYMERGNPTLKRARIDNVDLRWEWFPSPTEQLLVGLFYKYLKNPIEQVFVSAENHGAGGTNDYYMPQNLGNARNMGVEIDVVKYVRHFGVKANYTYTHSAITTSKRQYKEGSAEFLSDVTQTRPLVNQAPHTANVSLMYKDTAHGWNAQLASAYTGTRLAVVSPFKNADQWDKGMFSLDLSAEKKFKGGLSLFMKANNLTDAKRERYLKTVNTENVGLEGQKSDRTIVGTYRYGRTFLVGVRFAM